MSQGWQSFSLGQISSSTCNTGNGKSHQENKYHSLNCSLQTEQKKIHWNGKIPYNSAVTISNQILVLTGF